MGLEPRRENNPLVFVDMSPVQRIFGHGVGKLYVPSGGWLIDAFGP